MAEAIPHLWILAPVGALAANVMAQIVIFRLSHGAYFMRSIILGFLTGLAVLALLGVVRISLEGISSATLAAGLLVDAPIYVALSYCYYNFAQLGQTSVRIRLYTEIAARPGGMGTGDIALLYNEKALMNVRIQRLLESGDIVQRGDSYFIGRRRLVLVANIIFAAKRLLLGRESEFAPPNGRSEKIP